MAKYKIIPSSRTIVQSPISIGHKAEKGVEAIEFDVTAWVETYGSGTLTVIMRRWGDVIPYPIALEIDENNKATWTLSDIDTAKAGMAYAQLSYIVGDEVVKKSDIYTFRVMDSLTGEGDPPEAYESWLEHLTHFAAEAMAEVLDIEGIVTDKALTVDGGIADGKATGDALALKADKSTTYTKTEVDTLIESVDVETDTTLSVSGKPADAAETGRQIGSLKADLAPVGLAVMDFDTILTESGLLYGNGSEVENANYKRSKFIPVRNGDVFEYALRNANNAPGISFYTSADKSTIQTQYSLLGDFTLKTGQWTAPADGYIRVVTNVNVIGSGGYFRSANGIPTVLANDINLKNAMLGTLLVSSSGKYPEIDTTAKTLTIYSDTLLILRGDASTNVYIQMSQSTMVISYADISSSAVKVYFDIGTKVARAVAYNTVPNKDEVLICSMRVSSTNALVAMSCPYWVNGKPFSMNLDSLIGYEIIKTQSSTYTNVKAVNHRGFNSAPENTLPAYKLSKQKGFVYVETDVCYTSDGVAVLLHDNTINRTARNSDGTEIADTINISDITYAQALTYDFGIYKGSAYAGTKIPTFEQFISLCKNIGLKPYIEIKAGTVAQLTDLVNLVKSYGMIDNVTWIGGRIISNFTTIYDKARLGLVVNTITQDDITFAQSLMTGKNEVFIDALYRNLTTETVGMCISAGIPLEVWTVNVPSDILALSHYVSGVSSDNQIAGKLLYDSEMSGS